MRCGPWDVEDARAEGHAHRRAARGGDDVKLRVVRVVLHVRLGDDVGHALSVRGYLNVGDPAKLHQVVDADGMGRGECGAEESEATEEGKPDATIHGRSLSTGGYARRGRMASDS